jgi:malate dehydrogenase (oxaloacetate-decarboxylating)(NADP+)
VIYAEGEDERVLHAVRVVVDEGLARPILIGRPEVIEMRIEKIGLNLKPGRDFEIVNPESDPRYRELWTEYYRLMSRDGVTPDSPRPRCVRDTTLIGCHAAAPRRRRCPGLRHLRLLRLPPQAGRRT